MWPLSGVCKPVPAVACLRTSLLLLPLLFAYSAPCVTRLLQLQELETEKREFEARIMKLQKNVTKAKQTQDERMRELAPKLRELRAQEAEKSKHLQDLYTQIKQQFQVIQKLRARFVEAHVAVNSPASKAASSS